jgi:CTP:molybdopterin cytidylyltransferase MocA
VAVLRGGGVADVVLVVAPGDEALAAWGRAAGPRIAANPRPEDGMLSSILAGLAALGGPGAVAASGRPVLVCPADLPGLSPATVAAVLAALGSGACLAVPVHRGRRGHPLGIAPRLVAEVEGLDPAVGLRQLVARHAAEVVEIPVDDPGAVADLDTPEDYRAATGTEPGAPAGGAGRENVE